MVHTDTALVDGGKANGRLRGNEVVYNTGFGTGQDIFDILLNFVESTLEEIFDKTRFGLTLIKWCSGGEKCQSRQGQQSLVEHLEVLTRRAIRECKTSLVRQRMDKKL